MGLPGVRGQPGILGDIGPPGTYITICVYQILPVGFGSHSLFFIDALFSSL